MKLIKSFFTLFLTMILCAHLEAQVLTHTLSPLEKYDLQMLRWGGFAPLTTFHDQKDYQTILSQGRLANGHLWPIPIVLTLTEQEKILAEEEKKIVLMDDDRTILATMDVKDLYRPDVEAECLAVFGTCDDNHPFIQTVLDRKDNWYVSGNLKFEKELNLPKECIPPQQIRKKIEKNGWDKVVGFQTRNPLHRSHFELTLSALRQVEGGILLLTPVIGPTQPGDVDAATRIKCYRALLKYYPENQVEFCLIPLAMRMAGPKEALMHAIIRKNYGCTHFIIG